ALKMTKFLAASRRLNRMREDESAKALTTYLINAAGIATRAKAHFIAPSYAGLKARSFTDCAKAHLSMTSHLSRHFSMRMAVALNSAVPDLGSTASIVRSLLAT